LEIARMLRARDLIAKLNKNENKGVNEPFLGSTY
jgi:hypothetical protein